jgi:hypothetical protein
MGMLAVSVLAMFGITGVVLWFSSPGVLGSQGVSGGMGHYDYFMAYFTQSWSGYSGAYSLLTAMALAGGTLVVGLIPLWRFASRKHI